MNCSNFSSVQQYCQEHLLLLLSLLLLLLLSLCHR